MGLFSKKPPCPICGGKIGFLLPTKIEDEYICDNCAEKIDMQKEIKAALTMQEFKDYLMFYEQNQGLKDKFIISQKLDFGCFDSKMIFDFENKLFCMSKTPNKTVFEGAQLTGFTIKEDNTPLFEGSAAGLMRYHSTVPERVNAMAPQIMQLMMSKRMVETMDRMNDDDDDRQTYRRNIDIPEPFQEFKIELHFDHPYWETMNLDMSSPDFSNVEADVNDYLRDYQDCVNVMEQMAQALMAVAFPGACEIQAGNAGVGIPVAAAQPVASGDAIDEIKKYKSLMEEGIITKEEFDAKKKQLLGI